MYIINGIAYAGEFTKDIEITGIELLDGMMMLVFFGSGETRLFDTSVLSEFTAFKQLEDISIFETAKVENGIITWLNGDIDIAPETVYEKSFPYIPLNTGERA